MLSPALLAAVLIGVSPALERVLERTPADGLLAPLRRYEFEHRGGAEAAEAALMLGHLHYARGEYPLAADAFSRAAAGFEPRRKDEALYWTGLSWLGASDPRRARAVFEEVERNPTPWRPAATLGNALAWMMEGRPERASRTLLRLTARDAGETGPAALERLAALGERLGDRRVARRARERLRREYPRSFEALGVGAESPLVPTAVRGAGTP